MLAVGAAADAAPLLRPAGQSTLSVEKREQLAADPYVMRWREARMAVDGVFDPSAWDAPLALNLFPDAELRARVQSAKTLESGSRFLSGTLVGGGHFTMLRSAGGILRGEFHSARGVFAMRSQGVGRVLVEQRDVSSLPGCVHDVAMQEASPGLAPKALPTAPLWTRRHSRPAATTDGEEEFEPVDVLVLYTQRVEDHEGGPDEVIVTLENEIARMNQVLENSGLVGRSVRGIFEKVDYEQAENLSTDTNNLNYTEEDQSRFNREVDYSALDEVFPLIEKHQADLVHLFVRDAKPCGVATIYTRSKEYSAQRNCENSDNVDLCLYNERRKWWRDNIFAVTAMKCISNYTFPHELGHTLGLYHDRGDYVFRSQETFDVSGPFKNYAFGYQNTDFSEVSGFCQITVMSAGNECFFTGYSGQIQQILVPYFSNPDLFFPRPPARYDSSSFEADTPMGVPGDERSVDPDGPVNATRAIDEVWHLVAALSEPDADRLPGSACDLAVDTLSAKLPPSLVFAPDTGTRRFALPFSGQAECVAAAAPRVRTVAYRGSRRSLSPWPAASAFQVSVEPPTGERRAHRLSFAARRHWASCSAKSRAAAVVELVEMVDWEGGVSEQPAGARPASVALERGSAHAFCEGAPAKHLRRLGDFNGDGNADVLLRHADDRWRYHPMDGAQVLAGSRVVSRRLADGWQTAGIGDFNGDGKDDILMRHPQGRWRYYPMDGPRVLPGSGAANLPWDLAWQVAGIGDFSGDGKDDVLLRRLDGEWDSETREDWRFRAMDGRTMLGEGSPAGLAEEHPLTSWVAGVGDLNGDGRDDLLLRRLDGSWHYYPFHGGADGQSGLFEGHGVVALPNDLAWAVAGIADFNGDGKDDVLLRHEDGRWRYHRMDGRTVLGRGGSGDLPADATVWAAGVGDMDGDGKAEVLTRQGHDAWRYFTVGDNGAFAYGGEVELPSASAWGVLAGGVAAPPRASAAIGDQPLAIGADTALDLSEHFTGAGALVFEVVSSDTDVVRVGVASGVLTLTAVADGRATVTVTAQDADGHVVQQTFLVVATEGGVAGGRFRDCEECPEMVTVPAGSFMMGAPEEEEGSYTNERPVHQVEIAAPFAIGVHEVTFGQWDACVAAGGCDGYEPVIFHEGLARTSRPVTDVNWHDAQGYVAWLSAHTGETYRLPSEAEWEYAARAGTETPFHFGATITTDLANYDGTTAYGEGSVGEYRLDTLPVGSFPANAWGLHDVHGNVAEWTQDCYDPNSMGYAGAPADGSAWEAGDCAKRVERGGSWLSPPEDVRLARRGTLWEADTRIGVNGIRVVRELGE